jgi:hypothetical protein
MAAGTFTHPEGGKFRVASQRRFVVVGPWWVNSKGGSCVILYRTDDVQRAIDFATKKGGWVVDTVARKVRENVRTQAADGFYRHLWVAA